MEKLFKFWRYRIEIKLRKMVDKQRVEFLANELVKELNFNIDESCQSIDIYIFDKKQLNVQRMNENKDGFINVNCKYTGK